MKINTKTTALFTSLFICFFSIVSAQDTTNTIGRVNIASPTAASLGKYGDIPVSYHTGIPDITIPVYTIETSQLKLPINLSYHASGLKVQEQSSWVGAGWSLNAGGVITRSVIGAPDDKGYASNNVIDGYYSDYGYNSYLFERHSGNIDTTSDGYSAMDADFQHGIRDGEPDMYTFNFAGYSGKFYFNDDQTPVFVPEQDFKVQSYTQTGQGFTGFIVTTPDGTKYYFGKTGNYGPVDPVEKTTPSTLQDAQSVANAAASSWYLNKIMSADNMDSVIFIYDQEKYSYYTLDVSPLLGDNYNQSATNGINLAKNFLDGVRLKEIDFATGKISFAKSAAARKDVSAGSDVNTSLLDVDNTNSYSLGNISITDNNGFCKKYNFYYGYFYSTAGFGLNSTYSGYNIHSDMYRLRLDSLAEISCDGSMSVPPYRFSYYDTSIVPRTLSFGMDHWGFSNGVTGNSILTPTVTVISSGQYQQFGNANREPAFPCMRGGTLSKITYPTGGYDSLEFEANDTYANYQIYTQTNKGNFSVGYDGSTQKIYTYTTDNTSNVYELDIASHQTLSGGASIEFKNPSNVIEQNFAVASNSSAGPYYFTLSPNTQYTITVYSHATGSVDNNFYEWIPSNVSGNVMVGGLRIKRLLKNDGISATNNIISYSYTAGGGTTSSGILYSRPTYVQTIRNDAWGLVNGPWCSPGGCASCDIPGGVGHTYYISASSIRPLETTQGNHIGYNEVKVTQSGNGYSVYRYYGSTLFDNIISDVCIRQVTQTNSCSTDIPNFPAPPVPYEPMRGQLSYEGHFNEGGQVLKSVDYFPKYVQDPMNTPGIKYISIPGLYSSTMYDLYSYKKIQDSTRTTSWDPVAGTTISATDIRYYSSAYHNEVTKHKNFTSKGDSLITNTKYAFDFRITNYSVPDSLPVYKTATTRDSLWLYSTIGTCSPQVQGPSGCRYKTFQQFRRNINLDRIAYINYRKANFTNPKNNYQTAHDTSDSSADANLKPILEMQDDYINNPVEISAWKNNQLTNASFNKYLTTSAGLVYPNVLQKINLSAPSATFTNAVINSNGLTKDARYEDEVTVNYRLGNIHDVTTRTGATTNYIWDYNNSMPVARVVNALPTDTIAYTSFESNGTGNWNNYTGTITTVSTFPYPPTGTKYYNLTTTKTLSKTVVNGSKYIISYWSKNGSYSITGGTSSVITGITVNSWTFYQHTVQATTTSLKISGTGAIDEVRLFPLNAQVITYTYSPLAGMTSQCDANNRVTYYEYDALGRLNLSRDQNGNIIKKYQYTYQVNVP